MCEVASVGEPSQWVALAECFHAQVLDAQANVFPAGGPLLVQAAVGLVQVAFQRSACRVHATQFPEHLHLNLQQRVEVVGEAQFGGERQRLGDQVEDVGVLAATPQRQRLARHRDHLLLAHAVLGGDASGSAGVFEGTVVVADLGEQHRSVGHRCAHREHFAATFGI